MNNNMKKLNVIIIVLSVMILFMGVGYSILATRLSIKGVAKTTGKWQIEIVGIEPIENNTSAVSRDAKIINPTTVEFISDLYAPGDYIQYKITIANSGNIDAKLSSIQEVISNKYEYVKFSTNAEENFVLESNAKQELIVTIEFDKDAQEVPQEVITSNYILDLTYVQK